MIYLLLKIFAYLIAVVFLTIVVVSIFPFRGDDENI